MKTKILSFVAAAALAAAFTAGQAEAASSYVVKKGDTLWKIASSHKLTVDELKALNHLKTEDIKIDQKLIVGKEISGKPTGTKVAADKAANVKSVSVTKETSATALFKAPAPQADKQPAAKPNVHPAKQAATTAAALPNSSPSIMRTAVEISMPLLDTPYVWAGATPDGFDCSGFIYYVFKAAGMDLPRYDTIAMYSNSVDVTEPLPGDLVFFHNTYRDGISHAGIYIGDGNFIHAGTKKVEITSIDNVYWKDKFVGYKRFNQLSHE